MKVSLFAGLGLAVVAAGLLAGCGSQAEPLKQEEKKMLTAPLGQPMPEEAKRAMERANAKVPAGPGATR